MPACPAILGTVSRIVAGWFQLVVTIREQYINYNRCLCT